MSPRVQEFGHPSAESGISLIELMIAMTLGLLVIGAMTTVFINNSQARRELDKAAQQLENGRYAIQILRDEISMAGYYDAMASVASPPSTTASPCSTDVTVWKSSMDVATEGVNSGNFPCLTTAQAGTGMMFVQRASTAITAPASLKANLAYLQVSLCGDEYVSAVADKPFRVKLGTDPFDLQKIDCNAANRAPIRQYVRRAFFIDRNNIAGDGIPTLKRADFRPEALSATNPDVQALVEGIEDLHFEYAIDTNGDGTPEVFSEAPAANQLVNIVGVRVWLVARAIDATPGYDASTKTFQLGSKAAITFNDSFKRHVFSTYIELIHPVGRRSK
ncbi:PilW family protein [Aromatoleum toluclasticum]|uniref:PilW family protein n=1 Tax=Aromatoleum toluclasticum TaxID=92003 RepID=UPI001D18D8A6|nr:PilW family protein [Aromatoleum toluclasticum]MCC4116822.1 PilW family protein [Aromatoleum toluclasticum]